MKLFKVTSIILIALMCTFFMVAQEKADKKKDEKTMVRIENLEALDALKDLDVKIRGLDKLKALENIKVNLKGLDSLKCLENLDVRLEGLEALEALGDLEFDFKGFEAFEKLGCIKFDFDFSHLEGLAERITESVFLNLDKIFDAIDFMDFDFDWDID